MSYRAVLFLGAWDHERSVWSCDLVGYPAAKVETLRIGNKTMAREDWELGIREVRWIGKKPAPTEGQACLEVGLRDRISTVVLVALIGLIGSLGGAAIAGTAAFLTNTCPGKLERAEGDLSDSRAHCKKLELERNTCTAAVGQITSLCR